MSLSTIQFAPSRYLSRAYTARHIYLLALSLNKKYLVGFHAIFFDPISKTIGGNTYSAT